MRKSCVIFILILITSTIGLCEPIAIIVNKSNTIDDINLEILERIYKGKKQSG